MRENLYSLIPVKASFGTHDLTKMVHYLNRSRDLFLSPTEKEALFKERGLASTPMSRVFMRFVDDRVYNDFSLIAFSHSQNLHIPESLTYRHMTTDAEQIAAVDKSVHNTIKADPNLNKKLICNVTQVVRSDGRYYYLKDQERFQSLIVRDCLVRSFYVSRNHSTWLRASVILTLAKTYALLLGNNVSRWFELDQGSQDYVTMVFAMYFLGQCGDVHTAVGTMITKHKEFYLRDRDAVKHILTMFKDEIGGEVPDTLDECFKLINALGIDRLNVSRPVLTSKLRTIAEDLPSTAIALEYPPYFLWAVLNALSGAKNQLNIFLKRQGLMKDLQRATGELLQKLPSLN